MCIGDGNDNKHESPQITKEHTTKKESQTYAKHHIHKTDKWTKKKYW